MPEKLVDLFMRKNSTNWRKQFISVVGGAANKLELFYLIALFALAIFAVIDYFI